MKIAHLILLVFVFIIGLFSFTTFINFRQSENVKENAEFVSTSGDVIRYSGRFQRNILNMVSGLRGYLLTGESYFIQAYDSAAVENNTILNELSLLIKNDSPQTVRLAKIQELHNQWINNFSNPLKRAKATVGENSRDAKRFNDFYKKTLVSVNEEAIHKELQQQFREFTNYEYNSRERRRKVLAESVQQTKQVSIFLTAASIIIGFITVGFLIRRISARIKKMVNMANSIASGNYSFQLLDNSKDELSELSRSLNHMGGVLSENISLLKTKNDELDQFAHIVSHDLKAPLRGIGNVISWMEEDHGAELQPKVQEYIELIKGRIARSENLIQGILSYARIGKETDLKEDVSVAELIEEIKENIDLRPGITLDIKDDLPMLHTERFPLMQIFLNLITNALKYHHKAIGTIKIYSVDEGAHYRFFVEDDGPGIAEHHFKKIFVIFQTLKERDSFESTGVGLAIVRKILDARKESIELTSKLGQGSVFSFTWKKN